MFGFGRGGAGRKQGRGRHHRKGHSRRIAHALHMNLSQAEIGKKYLILFNPDIKTMEMGIYRGNLITVHKNEEGNPNIVVGVGETRYIIPCELAQRILIK